MLLCEIFAFFTWDPSREIFPFDLPLIGRPLLWYGFFFAFGFFAGYWILKNIVIRCLATFPRFQEKESCSWTSFNSVLQIKKKEEAGEPVFQFLSTLKGKAAFISERMTFYIITGVIIGARLVDVLFYQKISYILQDPLSILKVWEGGLASHGGALGAIAALCLLRKKFKKEYPELTILALLDLIVIPTALIACCIRIGNFFNQEILGKATNVPWAIIFKHPADGSPVMPRHPVQLYEALFYFLVFAVLFLLCRTKNLFKQAGKLSGVFLVTLFSFRFGIEYLKVEQSAWLGPQSALTMGQYLSIPFILLGLWLMLRKERS